MPSSQDTQPQPVAKFPLTANAPTATLTRGEPVRIDITGSGTLLNELDVPVGSRGTGIAPAMSPIDDHSNNEPQPRIEVEGEGTIPRIIVGSQDTESAMLTVKSDDEDAASTAATIDTESDNPSFVVPIIKVEVEDEDVAEDRALNNVPKRKREDNDEGDAEPDHANKRIRRDAEITNPGNLDAPHPRNPSPVNRPMPLALPVGLSTDLVIPLLVFSSEAGQWGNPFPRGADTMWSQHERHTQYTPGIAPDWRFAEPEGPAPEPLCSPPRPAFRYSLLRGTGTHWTRVPTASTPGIGAVWGRGEPKGPTPEPLSSPPRSPCRNSLLRGTGTQWVLQPTSSTPAIGDVWGTGEPRGPTPEPISSPP
ncbi:hypothetical protein V8F20_003929 [Naviculisporaceae sp. PSN 640]